MVRLIYRSLGVKGINLSKNIVSYNPADFISTKTVSSYLRVGGAIIFHTLLSATPKKKNSVTEIQSDGIVFRVTQVQNGRSRLSRGPQAATAVSAKPELHFGIRRWCCSEVLVQCRPTVGYNSLLGERHLKMDVFESKTKAIPVHVVKAYVEMEIELEPFFNSERGGGSQFQAPTALSPGSPSVPFQ